LRVVARAKRCLRSGPLGLISTAGWLIIMVAGADGTILLWRMRRIGLVVTVALCRVALVYYRRRTQRPGSRRVGLVGGPTRRLD
jgi:hypothetical protein